MLVCVWNATVGSRWSAVVRYHTGHVYNYRNTHKVAPRNKSKRLICNKAGKENKNNIVLIEEEITTLKKCNLLYVLF